MMPMIKVTDIAYGRLRSPDLDAQEAFLAHFGMVRVARTPHALYMRGTGHAVMGTPKLLETVQWFRDTLGFICSDDVYVEREDNLIGSFNRCDRGDEYVDHHVFFCLKHDKAGLNHLSFEVHDVDDVFAGHERLEQLN